MAYTVNEFCAETRTILKADCLLKHDFEKY